MQRREAMLRFIPTCATSLALMMATASAALDAKECASAPTGDCGVVRDSGNTHSPVLLQVAARTGEVSQYVPPHNEDDDHDGHRGTLGALLTSASKERQPKGGPKKSPATKSPLDPPAAKSPGQKIKQGASDAVGAVGEAIKKGAAAVGEAIKKSTQAPAPEETDDDDEGEEEEETMKPAPDGPSSDVGPGEEEAPAPAPAKKTHAKVAGSKIAAPTPTPAPAAEEEDKTEADEKTEGAGGSGGHHTIVKKTTVTTHKIEHGEQTDSQTDPLGGTGAVVGATRIAPFGKEDTARELQHHAARTQDTLVDAIENAEVAEIKRSIFRSLTRLRAAEIKEFDTIARLETQAIDEYNDNHHYRAENPLDYIHYPEGKVTEDKYVSFHD